MKRVLMITLGALLAVTGFLSGIGAVILFLAGGGMGLPFFLGSEESPAARRSSSYLCLGSFVLLAAAIVVIRSIRTER